ncbi:MAG: amidase [Rhodospirillaceae bacterium]|nr:amidase [Rhodospirillaceae bacterium]|tara:strand:+ start:6737 stop:8080 length:1344 start_codon:yes stop_codon:yes gene_type:complete
MTPIKKSYRAMHSAFANGTSSPSAFLEECLDTINSLEGDIGAFVATDEEGAKAAAAESDKRWKSGDMLSLIDGMPLCIKDIMETVGMPTQQGSDLFVGWQGTRDCAAVAGLREAGAVIYAKAVTTEFAAQPARGTKNPWDLTRTPGGSSSGTAASVAAGMLPGGLGTQGLGSTIRPASFCGVFAFKPSFGGINRGGSFDTISQSSTSTFAATLEETWEIARAITERVGGDPGFMGVSGPLEAPDAAMPKRLALLRTEGWDRTVDDAKRALENAQMALEEAGVEIVDRDTSESVAALEESLGGAVALSGGLNNWDFRWPLNTYARDMDVNGLSPQAQERLIEAQAMTLEEYQALVLKRRQLRSSYDALQSEFDACVTLSAPGPAPIGLGWTGDAVFAVPSSVLGTPSYSLPVLEAEGLPLGLQIMGFADQDDQAFSAARAVLGLFDYI